MNDVSTRHLSFEQGKLVARWLTVTLTMSADHDLANGMTIEWDPSTHDSHDSDHKLRVRKATLKGLVALLNGTVPPGQLAIFENRSQLKNKQIHAVRNALHCLFNLDLVRDLREKSHRKTKTNSRQWNFIFPLPYRLQKNSPQLNGNWLIEEWEKRRRASLVSGKPASAIKISQDLLKKVQTGGAAQNENQDITNLDAFIDHYFREDPRLSQAIIDYVLGLPVDLFRFTPKYIQSLDEAIPRICRAISSNVLKRDQAVSVLLNLSKFYIARPKFDLAKLLIDEARHLLGSVAGDASKNRLKVRQIALVKHYLAVLNYQANGNARYAIDLNHEAINLKKSINESEDLQIANSYYNLGLIYLDQDQLQETRLFLLKAFRIRRVRCANQLDRTNGFDGLARFYARRGCLRRAEFLYSAAIRINEGNNKDQIHSCLFDSYIGLGNLNLWQAQSILRNSKTLDEYFERAEYCYRQALQLNPSLPISIAIGQASFASLFFLKGQQEQRKGRLESADGFYDRAESLYIAAIDHLQSVCYNHPSLIAFVANLAQICKSRGKHREANIILHKVINLSARINGENHPKTQTLLKRLDEMELG